MSPLGSIDGNTPDVHPEAWIAPGAILVGRVTVDRGASVWYGSVLRAGEDDIIVGAECHIQCQCCLLPRTTSPSARSATAGASAAGMWTRASPSCWASGSAWGTRPWCTGPW